jgi:hypothetical protein
MPVVVNCTKCQKKLKIPDELLGKKVKCPTCSAVFTAEASEGVAEDKPAPKPAAKKPPVEDKDDDVPAPKAKRKPVDEDDEDEGVSSKPSKRKAAADEDDEDEPPKKSSKRKVDDDDDDDDAPKKKSKRRGDDDDDDDDDRPSRRGRGNMAPHRGVMILILGLCGILPCCIGLICGPVAFFLGSADIKKMDEGSMDPTGRTLTQVGRFVGLAFGILWVLSIIGGTIQKLVSGN